MATPQELAAATAARENGIVGPVLGAGQLPLIGPPGSQILPPTPPGLTTVMVQLCL